MLGILSGKNIITPIECRPLDRKTLTACERIFGSDVRRPPGSEVAWSFHAEFGTRTPGFVDVMRAADKSIGIMTARPPRGIRVRLNLCPDEFLACPGNLLDFRMPAHNDRVWRVDAMRMSSALMC